MLIILILSNTSSYPSENSSQQANTKTSSGWFFQNRLPVPNSLRKIVFTNKKRGWICGDKGLILHTNDGGKNWNKQISGTSKAIIDMSFINSNDGWAICFPGIVMQTSNGGETWKTVIQNKNYQFFKCAILNKDNLLILAKTDDLHSKTGVILFDAKENSIKMTYYNKQITCRDIQIIDEKLIYLIGYNTTGGFNFIVSKDGGRSWSKNNTSIYKSADCMFFLDSKNGWVAGNNFIMKTTDGGATWKTFYTTSQRDNLFRIYFHNPKSGYAVGFNNGKDLCSVLLETKDGGETWNRNTEFEKIFSLQDIIFSDKLDGWIIGTGGTIIHTDNGGENWTELTKGHSNSFKDVCFIDSKRGWIIGGKYPKESSSIISTVDGGEKWEEQYSAENTNLNSLFFIDEKEGWVVGNNGLILHTSNGGKQWNLKPIDSNCPLNNIFFLNKKMGWICGDRIVLYTEDSGMKWNILPLSIDVKENCYEKIHFFDNKRGWIIGIDKPYILETKDSGLTWHKIVTPKNIQLLENADFKAPGKIFIIGKGNTGGLIFSTSDFGKTWSDITPKFCEYQDFQDICFINSKVGWTTTGGEIFKTYNGGNSWLKQKSGTGNPLNKIFFLDEDIGWIVGNFGTILHTETGGE